MLCDCFWLDLWRRYAVERPTVAMPVPAASMVVVVKAVAGRGCSSPRAKMKASEVCNE